MRVAFERLLHTIKTTTRAITSARFLRTGMRLRAGLTAFLASAASSWVVRDVALPFVLTRTLLLCVGCLALTLLPRDPDPMKWQYSSHPWINMFSRWDAGWYLTIVQEGYRYQPGAQSNVAFAPLLPLLMRAWSVVIGRHDPEGLLLCGMIVANLALLSGLGYLTALARLDFDEATARRAVLYLLLFPTSFYLSAVYPQSLFLALTVAAFYYARREKWWAAGLCGALASLARLYGCILCAALACEYMAQRRFRLRDIRVNVLALGLILIAFAGWVGYLYHLSGDPWLFLKAKAAWNARLTPPWEVFTHFFGAPLVLHGPDHSLMDLTFTLLLLVLVVCCWRKMRPSYALFATLMLLTMISYGLFSGSMRFGLELFPIFFVLALAGRHPAFDRAYVIFGAGVGSLLMSIFALWYWVA
jgi:hypothetical protein